MSNYPAWWDKTITIYNRYTDPSTKVVTWYDKVLTGCFWKNVSNKVTVDNTVLETNSIICRIPEYSTFMERYLWEEADATTKGSYFTLGKDDIIVLGLATDEINEYQSGSRSTDFIKKYKQRQGCLTVQQWAIDTGSILNNPHYRIQGE